MPELPEVETVRRGLMSQLPGHTVTKVRVLRDDSVGHPSARVFAKTLVGHKFIDIQRRGKYLIVELDKGAFLAAHLRMSGRLLVADAGTARDSHIRVRIEMSNGEELIFEDMRVFGRLWYVSPEESLEQVVSGLADLGVEPLDEEFNGKYMQAAFKNKSQPIKSALLDQTIIAGIGNIYADESLHLAGIHPRRPAKALKLAELERLSSRIKDVLAKAIKLRGSTLRNYTDSSGVNGGYQLKAHVYGRTGLTCHSCSTSIERIKLGGRSSHFCPFCQPAKKSAG